VKICHLRRGGRLSLAAPGWAGVRKQLGVDRSPTKMGSPTLGRTNRPFRRAPRMRTIEKQVMGIGLRRGPEVGWVRLTTSGVGEGGALLCLGWLHSDQFARVIESDDISSITRSTPPEKVRHPGGLARDAITRSVTSEALRHWGTAERACNPRNGSRWCRKNLRL
jgi:hypothetical protein